ncbi:Nif-specific regulatory protein [Pseudobythopirellula maris]|uniref:Nif-specific regulatory protein n=1 Tax=Pseudobythopirellula maris TaxID=2527991 RepID=A0A5C5ZHZ7_9BACT|nr:sigma 54-interacting transcriptional regulator [Pseudobythopirellula maris]TWT86745.1 Nif-specific regulatory protein [Pseudobythopirellula maris]
MPQSPASQALTSQERQWLSDLSELTHCNPFEPRRIELERAVLGADFVPDGGAAWSLNETTLHDERPNVLRINALAQQCLDRLGSQPERLAALGADDAARYDDLVTYALYYRHLAGARNAVLVAPSTDAASRKSLAKVWRALRDDRERLLAPIHPKVRATLTDTPHVFACLHQVRRAFTQIFDCLIGESGPAARLRAQVWQSIFTHDMHRYRRTLFRRMGDLSTLVTGPSGAGKELVARAVGLSQYRPFDPEGERLVSDASDKNACEPFVALNLSAMSPTLIESELFGHLRGAFTGAVADRAGWLDLCPPSGAVFLDEIGELDPAIQVKLLRVTQSRDFCRLGDSRPRRFEGKLIAATNRDLAAEMRQGAFREDLYYRLCSDRIVVPSLREQLDDRPEALGGLIRFLTRRVVGAAGDSDDCEAESLAHETETWIRAHLPADYAWPGNTRELEQCVRSVLVRSEYRPPESAAPRHREPWLDSAARCELTADELLNHYCRKVHAQQGGYEQAARLLGLDRRTVKTRVEAANTGRDD